MHEPSSPAFVWRCEPRGAGAQVVEIPCDAIGRIDLDLLDEARRNDYFYARVLWRAGAPARVLPTHAR
jgi:hypothetical protein